MADTLKMYGLGKIPVIHSQVSEIADKIMNFTTKSLNQYSIIFLGTSAAVTFLLLQQVWPLF